MRVDAYGTVLGRVLYPAWERLRGRPTVEILHQLERTQRASVDELEAIRSGFLRRLIRHAYAHTAYYRALLDKVGVDPESVRAVADLARLPVLTRTDAQASVDDRTAAWPAAAYAKTTSGSTGMPLKVRFCEESRVWRDATRQRGFGWGGYRIGDKALHVWGTSAVALSRFQQLKTDVDRKLRRDVYVSCMVRGPEQLRGMVDAIRRERPDAIFGYAQAIADLARFINAEGLRDWDTIPVIYGAERLWQHDRDDLARAFGPAVFETYGSRELMLIGCECEHHDGLHESAENLVVEILVREADGALRPARPGERGEITLTDLHNLACPFIRYQIGDTAIAHAPAPCGCGRTLARFGPVEGRVTDTMRDGDGNAVEGLVFNILFLHLAQHAKQFQVVQRVDRRLIVRVVPAVAGQPLDRAAETLIRDFVGKNLKGVPLEIELVDAIPLSKAGKLHRVIVERAA